MHSLFRVSERQHSGFILMTELATFFAIQRYISLSEIADRMHLSGGYLEEIALRLKEAGLILGRKGPGGGYRLTRNPEHISAREIIEALEGEISLVDCQRDVPCPVQAQCSSKQLWSRLQTVMLQSLNETSLSSIANLV